MKKQSLIKWTGSKRHLADEIINYMDLDNKNINTYFEPFLGGGSMFLQLVLQRSNNQNKINEFILNDLNSDLIDLWKYIYTNPSFIYEEYLKLWKEFNMIDKNIPIHNSKNPILLQHRKDFFKEKRIEFNKTRNSALFFFLTRTSLNGLVRYNQKNEFNTSCHFTRPGISPDKVKEILFFWNNILNQNNIIIHFENMSYEELFEKYSNKINKKSMIFLDPPYLKSDGIYFGCLLYDEFFKVLENLSGKTYLSLTFDSKEYLGNQDFSIEESIFHRHIELSSKNSSFNNLNNIKKGVQESLFLNF